MFHGQTTVADQGAQNSQFLQAAINHESQNELANLSPRVT